MSSTIVHPFTGYMKDGNGRTRNRMRPHSREKTQLLFWQHMQNRKQTYMFAFPSSSPQKQWIASAHIITDKGRRNRIDPYYVSGANVLIQALTPEQLNAGPTTVQYDVIDRPERACCTPAECKQCNTYDTRIPYFMVGMGPTSFRSVCLAHFCYIITFAVDARAIMSKLKETDVFADGSFTWKRYQDFIRTWVWIVHRLKNKAMFGKHYTSDPDGYQYVLHEKLFVPAAMTQDDFQNSLLAMQEEEKSQSQKVAKKKKKNPKKRNKKPVAQRDEYDRFMDEMDAQTSGRRLQLSDEVYRSVIDMVLSYKRAS